jgi:nicotinamidase-related amidase
MSPSVGSAGGAAGTALLYHMPGPVGTVPVHGAAEPVTLRALDRARADRAPRVHARRERPTSVGPNALRSAASASSKRATSFG